MTTKKVTNTLLSFLRKPSKAVECQTITFEEFEKQFTDQIERLENNLKSKNEERKIIEKDIDRMKKSLEVLALERS
jgi:DNA polymerase II small subunit/DNA polymerase delta subunit B